MALPLDMPWGLGGWGQPMERLEFGFAGAVGGFNTGRGLIAGFGFENDGGVAGSTQAMTSNFYAFLCGGFRV